ncbi:MAG TPA: class I fructose-bisphosphate aldolase [Opitutaceae bacterium]|nr:class I fructose-bisphosphate aldolase [Opitutaceae bacterium]
MTTPASAIQATPAPEATIRDLLSDGKGILAADESTGTIEKRLHSVGVDSTITSRRAYREMLFTAPGLAEYVGGVILYEETLRQTTSTGQPMVDLLRERGLVPGIKVDRGTTPLAGFPGEKITEGLDGLRERLAEYAGLGAAFTKWRAVFSIGRERPSLTSIAANAHALARFAALTQEAGLVPIVEPEVLAEGDHPLERTEEVTAAVLAVVFHELRAHRVVLNHMLLKPNMVLPGRDHRPLPSREAVAEATLRCLRRTVPAAVPGIVFLSGGQSETEATEHLAALNSAGPAPWALSFSFGRALQSSALAAWRGDEANVQLGQAALLRRARANSVARRS